MPHIYWSNGYQYCTYYVFIRVNRTSVDNHSPFARYRRAINNLQGNSRFTVHSERPSHTVGAICLEVPILHDPSVNVREAARQLAINELEWRIEHRIEGHHGHL
ncbi:hypothetical protein FE257_011200 [Aspergillus nanangensis]|uniref:Uncharacterized protein n=1 Tax=Aspergillus nanangensis TaxID=2582783 RepID=A0AAD4CHM7_ASPNN|nr:hypothetical protein FE257_011200 [Aspergillus nanangensis]